ncbi:MAG: histidine-type phosphatase [Burkholderiales bacterium]
MRSLACFAAGVVALCAAPFAAAQLSTWPTFTFGPSSTQADEVLQKLVIVSRHGVRTPIPPASQLAHWSPSPWPDWKQPPGALTPRGAELAKIMGAYYRRYASEGQATTAAGCPPIYVYADLLERTQGTAQALIEGFAPNCGYTYRTRADAKIDPLFHPLEAGVCRLDPMVAQTRVLERAGGDLNRITRDLKAPFDALQSALQCCSPALCTALGRGEKCTLADLPTVMSPLPDGAGVDVMGSLAIASTTAEILLLEYADNLPMEQVGFGRVTVPQMRDSWRLHTEYFDLVQRTPYLARRKGSALLFKVAAAVTSARSAGFGMVEPAIRDARFVAYVGHDTNIWNLAGMLDTSWSQAGYQRNQTPPGGALLFEVRETADKKLKVYTSYVAQSPEQMRNATPLVGDALPLRTPLRLPGCSSTQPGFACTIEEFAIAARNALDRDCVSE